VSGTVVSGRSAVERGAQQVAGAAYDEDGLRYVRCQLNTQ
jgi:hypothetical protein